METKENESLILTTNGIIGETDLYCCPWTLSDVGWKIQTWIRRNIFSASPHQLMRHLLGIKRPRQQIYNSLVFWPAQRSSVITANDKAFPMKQVSGNASYSQDPEDPAFPPEQLPPDSGDDVSGNAHTASYGKEDVEILELQDIVPVGDSLQGQPLLKEEFQSGPIASMP